MVADLFKLNEVVVVRYGSQKKVGLTWGSFKREIRRVLLSEQTRALHKKVLSHWKEGRFTGTIHIMETRVGEPSSIIRKGDFKPIHYWDDGRNELYDLEKNPKEEHNIASSNIEKVKKQFDDFLREVNAKRPKKDTRYNETEAQKFFQRRGNVMLPNLEEQRMCFLSKDFEPNRT